MPASTNPVASPRDAEPQAPRYLPLETVAIRLVGAASPSGQPILGILSNLSDTGACVIANVEVPTGGAALLELESPRWPEKVVVESELVWCAERMEPVKEIVGFLIGLSFEPSAAEPMETLLKSGIFQLIP